MNIKVVLGIAASVSLTLSAASLCAENEVRAGASDSQVSRNESKEAQDQRASVKLDQNTRNGDKILLTAREVISALKKTTADGVPDSVKEKAECVAIIPGLVTAAVGVGGSRGSGVAVCKTNAPQTQASKNWSNPAFVNMTGASLGAQVGIKQTDVVLYITSKKAAESLKRGDIEFGADMGVVAGKFERGFNTSNTDVVAYQNNSGAFAGAAIGGGNISADQSLNKEYYGRDVAISEILNGNVKANVNQQATLLTDGLD